MDVYRENARQASTEDLLDRVTVFRKGMEAEALDVFEAELRRRGVHQDAIIAHLARRNEEVIWRDDGTAYRCNSYDSRYTTCQRPAIGCRRGWHLFIPRTYYYCSDHQPVT